MKLCYPFASNLVVIFRKWSTGSFCSLVCWMCSLLEPFYAGHSSWSLWESHRLSHKRHHPTMHQYHCIREVCNNVCCHCLFLEIV